MNCALATAVQEVKRIDDQRRVVELGTARYLVVHNNCQSNWEYIESKEIPAALLRSNLCCGMLSNEVAVRVHSRVVQGYAAGLTVKSFS